MLQFWGEWDGGFVRWDLAGVIRVNTTNNEWRRKEAQSDSAEIAAAEAEVGKHGPVFGLARSSIIVGISKHIYILFANDWLNLNLLPSQIGYCS